MQKPRSTLLLVVLTVLLISIPLTVYLTLTGRFTFKQAAVSATISFTPPAIVTSPNQQSSVDVYINSGEYGLTSTTLDLQFDTTAIALKQVEPKGAFTYVGDDPSATTVTNFSLTLNQNEQNKPKGNIHVATLKFQLLANKSGTVAVKKASSQVNGVNLSNQQTVVLEITGSPLFSYASTSSLCRINACPAVSGIQLRPVVANAAKYHIEVTWTAPQTSGSVYYRVYRNIGTPVPTNHPDQNSIGFTNTTTFVDTNGTTGFTPNQTVHYDIDTYRACDD